MDDARKKTLKGELILIQSGAYSDFEIHGLFRATRDFVLASEARRYIVQHPEGAHDPDRYPWEDPGLVNWLFSEGLIEPVRHRVAHLWNYSHEWSPEKIEEGYEEWKAGE